VINIGGIDYTLYRDYDRGNFRHLDLDGKVAYMRARVDIALVQPCKVALTVADRVHVGLIVATIVCAGISAGSTFQHGRQATRGQDRAYFATFVRDYMHPCLQGPLADPNDRRVMCWSDWMYYRLRNGLAHGFVIEFGGLDRVQNAYVGAGGRFGEPIMDLPTLVDDFDAGWNGMLDQILQDPASQLANNFAMRFLQIFAD
jgi:hypothetical protein